MIESIDFGEVKNIVADVPSFVDCTHRASTITVEFTINRPETWINLEKNIRDILDDPDGYVFCRVGDIIKAQDEVLTLKDKVNELEKQLAEAKKDNQALKEWNGEIKEELDAVGENAKLWYSRAKDLQKDCDYWNNRFGSVTTNFADTLASNGVELKLKGINDEGNWDVAIDIPELNEAKAKVAELEEKLKAAKSNVTYWRERKEEEEKEHHYWLHTYGIAVAHAANEGVRIIKIREDEENNVGVVLVKNEKAEELEKKIKRLEDDNSVKAEAVVAAKDRGDYWKRTYDDLAEYWDNTYNGMVAAGKKVGVKIEFKGDASDSNEGNINITNEKAIELMGEVSDTKHEYNKKWHAMLGVLKDKGVGVIYMGEKDDKPIIEVKVPEWESDRKWVQEFAKRCGELRSDKFRLEGERDELKEKCDILRKDGVLKRQQCLKLKADLDDLKADKFRLEGELEKARNTINDLNAEIDKLNKETVAEVRYEFRPDCFTVVYTKDDGTKEVVGMDLSGYIQKEPDCKDCKYYARGLRGSDLCHSPKTKFGFCRNNCGGEEACPEFEAKE